MTKQLTLKEYESMLKQHDWYYMMSEDSSVYKSGCHNMTKLRDLSTTSKEHKELFNKYQNKYKIN